MLANPLVAQRLGLANTLLNARSPAAAIAEQNIYNNQATTIAKAQRGATDASQLLLTGNTIQDNTNDAFNNLESQEAEDYQRRYQNQVAAQGAAIEEQDKVFQDKVRRFNDKFQIEGAQVANNANSWGDLSNFGFSLADFGMNGGFNGMFGNRRPVNSRDIGNTAPTNWRRPTYNPITGRIE